MKKIILIFISISLFACEREEIKMRNYTYPADKNNPTGLQIGAAIHVYEGETDEDLIKRIREFEYYGKDFSDTNKFPYIFLSTDYYDETEVKNPSPDYMLFPHSINSTSDKWGWEYLDEYKTLGEQEFCNKYLNGKKTLGMKLTN